MKPHVWLKAVVFETKLLETGPSSHLAASAVFFAIRRMRLVPNSLWGCAPLLLANHAAVLESSLKAPFFFFFLFVCNWVQFFEMATRWLWCLCIITYILLCIILMYEVSGMQLVHTYTYFFKRGLLESKSHHFFWGSRGHIWLRSNYHVGEVDIGLKIPNLTYDSGLTHWDGNWFTKCGAEVVKSIQLDICTL